MKTQHNHIGTLSIEQLEQRSIYCEKLKQLHEKRTKLANLKNLLKPTLTPIPAVKMRPSNHEKITMRNKRRLDTMHAYRPEALQSLREFRKHLSSSGGKENCRSQDHLFIPIDTQLLNHQYLYNHCNYELDNPVTSKT